MAVLPSKRQGYSFGVAVGLIASSVFVLVNQGALPTISRISSVVIWMLLVAAIVWAVWLKRVKGWEVEPLVQMPWKFMGFPVCSWCMTFRAQ